MSTESTIIQMPNPELNDTTQSIYIDILQHVQKRFSLDVTQLITSTSNSSQPILEFVTNQLTQRELPKQQKQRILDEFFGWGPVQKLLAIKGLNEIIINCHTAIWIEIDGHLSKYDDYFFSILSYKNFVIRLCQQAKIQLNLNHAFANGSWNQFRIHIVDPSMTEGAPVVSLRKHDFSKWTLSQLLADSWASALQIGRIKKIISEKRNFIIIGPTSSGKTSVLNACLQECNQNERIVCIEDTSEIRLPNLCSSKILTRDNSFAELRSYDQGELVKQSLRMRPDRIIMGEVRGPEAKDLLMALSTGHKGSICTLHANSAHESLIRLEMLIQLGAPNWSLTAIRKLIYLSLDFIVVLKKEQGRRYLDSIYRLSSIEDCGILLEKDGLTRFNSF